MVVPIYLPAHTYLVTTATYRITAYYIFVVSGVQERSTELEIVEKVKDEIRLLSGQLANVEFTYRDPVKNFDRSKVKGVVAKLIKVKDSSTVTALEVSLGKISFSGFLSYHCFGKDIVIRKVRIFTIFGSSGCCWR